MLFSRDGCITLGSFMPKLHHVQTPIDMPCQQTPCTKMDLEGFEINRLKVELMFDTMNENFQ